MTELFKAEQSDTAELKNIFSVCFDESAENTEVYFDCLLSYKYAYAAKYNGEICSALYLLPSQSIALSGEICKSNYLFAAGTLPEYRKKGIMERLINFALEDAKNKGDCISALYPASDELYGYYKRFDYRDVYMAYLKTYEYSEICALNGKNLKKVHSSFDNMTQLRFNIIKDIKGSMLFSGNYLLAADRILQLYGGGTITFDKGYIMYYAAGNTAVLQEVICKKEDVKDMLYSFAQIVKAGSYAVRLPWHYGNSDAEDICRFGMMKLLNADAINADGKSFEEIFKAPYLGLTLD